MDVVMRSFILLLVTSAHLMVEGRNLLASDLDGTSQGDPNLTDLSLRKASHLDEILTQVVVDKTSSVAADGRATIDQRPQNPTSSSRSWSSAMYAQFDQASGGATVQSKMQKDNVTIDCVGLKDSVVRRVFLSVSLPPLESETWSMVEMYPKVPCDELACTFTWIRSEISATLYQQKQDGIITSEWQVDNRGLYRAGSTGFQFVKPWKNP